MNEFKVKSKIISLDSNQITLEIYPYNKKQLEKFIDTDIKLSIKEYKTSRSLEQNSKLWALIDEIDTEQNGYRSSEGMLNIYKAIILDARIKVDYFMMTKEAAEELRKREIFRIVEKIQEKGKYNVYRCYIGSSKFNKKEMADFIEATLRYARNLDINLEDYSILQHVDEVSKK